MRSRARAASLCVAALLTAALLPAAAQAFTPVEPGEGDTHHNRVWPGTVAMGMNSHGTPEVMVPGIISPGPCDPGDGTRTFTFSYADHGVVLWADGRFEEHGSFTLARVDGEIRVTDFDSTFSGSSPNGSIEGERHLRPEQLAASGPVTCSGTTDADRYLSLNVYRVYTEHRLTVAATGAVIPERGFAVVSLASLAAHGYGHYFSLFESDEDDDGRSLDYDNCDTVANPDQADSDGDGIGDACEGGARRDSDGDRVFDHVDNCVHVANANQTNLDGDAAGDACDPDDDGDGVNDAGDNCPRVPNPAQADADADGVGDACEAFESNDGFAGGGGKLEGDVHVSVALHSRGGSLHGSGELAAGATRVRLRDLTGLRSDGDRVVAIGTASVDGGEAVAYRLEIVDSTNAFALEVGGRRWAGSLTNGNLVVK